MVRAVLLLSEGMGIVGQSEAAAKCNNQRRSIGDIGVERLGRNTVTVCVQCAIGERTKNCKQQTATINSNNIGGRRAARIDDRYPSIQLKQYPTGYYFIYDEGKRRTRSSD